MLTILVRASIDGAVFALLVWTLTRALPRLSPSAKTILWWCVSAKFIAALVWTTPIPLPVLPAAPVSSVTIVPQAAWPAGDTAAGLPVSAQRRTGVPILLWASGVALSLAAGWRRWRKVQRAMGTASPAPEAILEMTREVAARLRLSRIPGVRFSDDVETPLVAGIMRPVILVPARRFACLATDRQRMTICHELAHVKRGDLWFGCAAGLAERLFFFHPLAHLAAREYVFWREAACDAAVIDALGATPHDYGRLLLDLGISAPRRTLAAAGAAWSFANLKRRIVMLGRPSARSMTSRLLAAAALAVAIVGIIPMTLTARTVPSHPVVGSPAPLPSRTVVPAVTAAAPVVVEQRESRKPQGAKEEDATFVLFLTDRESTMSGSSEDMTRARQLRRNGEPMLWFRHHGTEYIVRDEGMLREVRRIWQAVSEIGEAQGRLGAQQGALGAAQGNLGARQGEIGTAQGVLGTQQGALALRQAMLAAREMAGQTAAERADLDAQRRALEVQLRDLDRQMRALEPKMRELDKPMRELSDQMNAMSKDMEALGERMTEASAKAQAQMRELLDRAIAGGLAQIVR
jgi:bla regulator protein blaR1